MHENTMRKHANIAKTALVLEPLWVNCLWWRFSFDGRIVRCFLVGIYRLAPKYILTEIGVGYRMAEKV